MPHPPPPPPGFSLGHVPALRCKVSTSTGRLSCRTRAGVGAPWGPGRSTAGPGGHRTPAVALYRSVLPLLWRAGAGSPSGSHSFSLAFLKRRGPPECSLRYPPRLWAQMPAKTSRSPSLDVHLAVPASPCPTQETEQCRGQRERSCFPWWEGFGKLTVLRASAGSACSPVLGGGW